jgi:hypothetical protein
MYKNAPSGMTAAATVTLTSRQQHSSESTLPAITDSSGLVTAARARPSTNTEKTSRLPVTSHQCKEDQPVPSHCPPKLACYSWSLATFIWRINAALFRATTSHRLLRTLPACSSVHSVNIRTFVIVSSSIDIPHFYVKVPVLNEN